jgi:tryptophanyl-tRNA synthetase
MLVELFEGKEKRKTYEKLYLGSGIKYKKLKEQLSKSIYKELEPIQKKIKYYQKSPEIVDEILEQGKKYASKIAKKTLMEVKEKMGLL